jgi:predicted transcriptional regulator
MSKRLYEYNQLNHSQGNLKKTKINKKNTSYINITVNDMLFHEYTLNELRDFSNEITDAIDKLRVHKERIDSILAIYS